MTARRRPTMRRLVDATLDCVRSGDVSAELAASMLLKHSVPVAVIGRVLETALSDAALAQQNQGPSSGQQSSTQNPVGTVGKDT